LTTFGQTPRATDLRELPPNQTLEREMAGAETHRYKVGLRKGEFFQVRVEQRGLDVALKLLDESGNVLAAMDSPNGKEGFETLSFTAAKASGFVLEIGSLDAEAGKGIYVINRASPRAATERDKRRIQVERVFVEGIEARDKEGQAELSIAKLEEALKGWQELDDGYLTELTSKSVKNLKDNEHTAAFIKLYEELNKASAVLDEGSALALKSKADSLSARAKINEALTLYRALDAKVNDKVFVEKINQAGAASQKSLNHLKFLQFHVKVGETSCLDRLAQTHYNLSEWQEQIDYLNLAFAGYQKIVADKSFISVAQPQILQNIKILEAGALRQVGDSLDALGKSEESLKYLNQSLGHFRLLYEETRDSQIKLREADSLTKIGLIYGRESRNSAKAIEFFAKSFDIYRDFPDKKVNAARTLSLIALQYMNNLQYEEAKKKFEDALQIYREIDNKFYQSQILQTMGGMYSVLNNKSKVSEYVNQSLAILHSPDYVENWIKHSSKEFAGFEVYVEWSKEFIEYQRLDGIGYSYRLLEDHQKSLDYYRQGLAAASAGKDRARIRLNLRDVGYTLGKLGKWGEAVTHYQGALAISRSQGVREDTARDLQDVGSALLEVGDSAAALTCQNEALIIYQAVGVDENKAFSPSYSSLLNDISRSHHALGNKRLAIFYGKKAVNAMQSERQRLHNLDLISQKGYLEKKEKHYRRLSDWLIAEGRILEAEKVLEMLKQDEIFDYVRRDASEADKLQKRPDLTPEERDALARYDKLADEITSVGLKFGKLQELQRQGIKLDAEQQKSYEALAKQNDDANYIFQAFLKQLAEEFSGRAITKSDLNENFAVQSKLRSWGEGVVFLYTLVGEDRYRVILVTPDTKTDGKTEIKSVALNEKISRFRAAVMNRAIDPRPLGKELYDTLIKPIEKQLDGAKAKTLLWSLDGNLRLLPLAALWDGKQYFGQKYQNVTITLASRDNLGDAASRNWRALGLGVSEAKTVTVQETNGARRKTFEPLPAVKTELESIVRSEKSPNGVLPGQILLDAEFNEAELKKQLLQGYNLIHIASHFSLNAGDATKSFLLLGDGQTLSVDKIKNNSQLKFHGIELLTLSACETAVGEKDSSGKEIEGFGYVAQQNGAKAILATLWSVADESTQLLMSEFYRLRKERPELSKAAALQLAQQEMIEGKLQSSMAESAGRGLRIAAGANFAYDSKKPYAHPYYWSPFILIGNWR
jgi:CHAT domain-containing protein